MKKRLFAGALALLMIIGLLPVSSLLKKPMEAKAGGNEYNFSPAGITVDNTKATNNVDTVFTFDSKKCKTEKINATLKDGETKITDPTVFRFGGQATYSNNIPTNRYIEITVSKNATLSLKWASGGAGRGVKVIKKESNNVGKDIYTYSVTKNERNVIFTKEIPLEANVVYYVAPSVGDMYIYSMVVTEESTDAYYKVTVIDPANSETPKTSTIAEGKNITYTAQGTNFAYWLNSNGVKVSTSETLNMPVYYSDTYTAVYAKIGAKVEYLTPYGGVLATYYAEDVKAADFKVPDGPTRYGYTFDSWDTDVNAANIDTLLASGDIIVEPKYKDNAGLKFTITIDTTQLGGSQSTDTYTVNTEVKASTTSKDFAYWADDNGKPLSYNSTYYFLANRKITVKAVKKSDSDNNATEKPIITKVNYDKATKTVIYEYTVPEGYTINYAGVLASTNETNLNNATVDTYAAGVYKLGTSECAGYKTVRYTLKNAGIDTWYVKPILTYKNATGTDTIYGAVDTMN